MLLAALLCAVSACFGAPAACVPTTATSTAVAGSQTGGVTIAAAGGGANPTDFTSLNTAGGCQTVDLLFNNFSSTGGSATNSGTYISTLANQNLAAGQVTVVFSTVRGADNVQADGDNNDGINNWAVPATARATFYTNYQFTSSDIAPDFFNVSLAGVQLGVGGLGGDPGHLRGAIQLCLGGTFSGSVCSAGAGNIQTISVDASLANFYHVQLNSASRVIGVQNSFLVVTGGASGATFLTAFGETFGEAPEPSTFVLLGFGLAGFGFLRYSHLRLARR